VAEHSGRLEKKPVHLAWTATCDCGWRGELRWAKAAARQDVNEHIAAPEAAPQRSPRRALADETEPAAWMSTHALKTELLARLAELEPQKRWPKGVTVTELADHAIHSLDPNSDDPVMRRTIEVATALWQNERR
jgi:hypothetical protein